MATVVLFRCARFALDDLAEVVEAGDLRSALETIRASTGVVVLLVGPGVKGVEAQRAIEAVVRRQGYFLRIRVGDTSSWIRRLLRVVLRSP